MLRRTLAIFAGIVLTAGCKPAAVQPGSAPTPKVPSATAPSATEKSPNVASPDREAARVARALARVAERRQLPAKRPVLSEKLSRSGLVERVKEKALREFPPHVLRLEGKGLELLGLAPQSFDYVEQTLSLLEAQLEGFYEPTNETMYLANELKGKEADATLSHELVHALQDQHWDLKKRSGYRPGEGDRTFALACLAEGDATSLMLDELFAEKNSSSLDIPNDWLRATLEASALSAKTEHIPHILRASLLAPYTDGLMFVQALRREGGWKRVDEAWAAPPETTEQVLHPEKWRTHEPALAVKTPTAARLGKDWTLALKDTMGELQIALMFSEWAGADAGRTLAEGWGGDRSATFVRGDEVALTIVVRFDEPKFAARAWSALAPALSRATRGATTKEKDALCIERPSLGPLSLRVKGDSLAITAGPAIACKAALAWAEEALSPR